MSFQHGGSNVRVGLAPQVAGQPSNPRTRVVARFGRGLPFRLELAPVARPRRPSRRRGRAWFASATRSSTARSWSRRTTPRWRSNSSCPSVRWAIDNLLRLAPPGGMLISINPERMLVQVDRNLGLNPESLARRAARRW